MHLPRITKKEAVEKMKSLKIIGDNMDGRLPNLICEDIKPFTKDYYYGERKIKKNSCLSSMSTLHYEVSGKKKKVNIFISRQEEVTWINVNMLGTGLTFNPCIDDSPNWTGGGERFKRDVPNKYFNLNKEIELIKRLIIEAYVPS